MQEWLIGIAGSIKVLNQSLEAGPIERQKERLDIGPGWRSAFVLGHDQTVGMMDGPTEQLAPKIHDLLSGSTMPERHDGRPLVTEESGHGRSRYAFHVTSKTRALEQREVYRRQAAPS